MMRPASAPFKKLLCSVRRLHMSFTLADYPQLPLSSEEESRLAEQSIDWALSHGLAIRTPEHKGRSDRVQMAPISLLPSPVPRKLFDKVKHIQDEISCIHMRIAYDRAFLKKAHEKVITTDEYTRRLLDIYERVMDEGVRQPMAVGVIRSDYMTCKDKFSNEYGIKQIENNMIASSMGGHAERVSAMHRRTLRLMGWCADRAAAACPDNKPIEQFGRDLFNAWTAYGDPSAVCLVLIEDLNQNIMDQRHVEYAIEAAGLDPAKIVRRTLTQCYESTSLSESGELLLDGTPVGLVYMRSGYGPDHYKTDNEWEARLRMERSSAIKCPWIGLQLAGTKKVQQVLAEDGVVEKYASSPAVAAAIRQTFAGLWSLDEDDALTKKVIKHAIAHPDQYVLKPQLEGGAGNYYGEVMQSKLSGMSLEERAAHILMERIHPLVVENYLLRAFSDVEVYNAVSELGIYGTVWRDASGALSARTVGHLLRTKGHDVDEGGVAVGAAVIDSPFLYELL